MCIKKKLYKQIVRNNCQEYKLLYTKYKNILTSVLIFIQKEYYHNKCSINIHNSKGTWKLIKNIINISNDNKNNYECKNNDSSFSIANKCNDIFSNVGNNLAKLIINPNINTTQ